MSHNPTRAEGNRNLHQRPTPAPRPRIYATLPLARQPAGDKILTTHGHTIKLFESEQFCVRYETMHARNSTGRGVSATGDRVILVSRGTLFVTIKNADGKFDDIRVIDGQHLNLPAGTEYCLSTGGDIGCDFQVTESAHYHDGWQQLEEPTVGAVVPMAATSIQSAPTVVRRGHDDRTMAHAQQLQTTSIERRKRAAERSTGEFSSPGNANSSSVTGVSPMPGGIPREE